MPKPVTEKVSINKIVLKIGDKEIALTPAQLRELKDVLETLFPEKVKYIPTAPIIIEKFIDEPWRLPRQPWQPKPFWCGDIRYGVQKREPTLYLSTKS